MDIQGDLARSVRDRNPPSDGHRFVRESRVAAAAPRENPSSSLRESCTW